MVAAGGLGKQFFFEKRTKKLLRVGVSVRAAGVGFYDGVSKGIMGFSLPS